MAGDISTKKKSKPENYVLQDINTTPSSTTNRDQSHQNLAQAQRPVCGGPTYWSVVASLSFLCTGLLRAYTSPALLSIQNEKSPQISLILSESFSSTKDAISWIASTPPLASFLGTILSGPLLQYCGRQRTLTFLSVIATTGWLLVSYAASIKVLLLGRALTGLASGLATATAPLYISEVVASDPVISSSSSSSGSDRRGLLPGVMLAIGILLGFILAHQIQAWRPLALVIALFPGLLTCLCCTIPESPLFISRLSGSPDKRQFDLQMEPVFPSKKQMQAQSPSGEKTGLIPKVKRAVNFPVYLRVGLLMLLQQWSGGNVLIYYLSEVLAKNPAIENSSSPSSIQEEARIHQASLIIALIQFLGFFLALPLINHPRIGRRSLLLLSAVLMALCHSFLGMHFHRVMKNIAYPDYYNSHLDFVIRVASLAALLSCYSIGLSSIPFLFIEHQKPTSSHSNGNSSYLSSFASFVNHLALFVAVKAFPYLFHMERQPNGEASTETHFLSQLHGPDFTFWLFAGVCWITALFALHSLPRDTSSSL